MAGATAILRPGGLAGKIYYALQDLAMLRLRLFPALAAVAAAMLLTAGCAAVPSGRGLYPEITLFRYRPAAARRPAAAGVRFVGVDVSDNQASALAYMRHFRIGYPSVDDPGDAIVLNFHKIVPIAEFPSTLLISRDGRIAARVIGAVTYAELERLIRKVAG